MTRRVERSRQPLTQFGAPRGRKAFAGPDQQRTADFALLYSNGYVTVEISHDALDAYIELHGDVPVPVAGDAQTGDRQTYDARHNVRVVYDAAANIREVSTLSREGLFVRVNFTDDEDG